MSKEMAKAYEPKEYEDEIYRKWEENGFFNPDCEVYKERNNKKNKGYSIVMPPPNVTGTLHMGHASMLALEDILTRFYRMQGYDALWLPGTDHAAIATQTKVEKIIKQEGTNRHEMGREKFLERVRQFAQDSHDTIVNQTKKMGSSCDWTREAYTLDETRSKAVRSVFKLMYDDGLIYRGERIVNWCPRCKSTLADDEVEYKEQKAKFYTFKYDKNFPIAISTTRPETKLGDTAVAVNPKDERYKEYIGKTYDVDFCGVKLKIKVIADRHVDMEFGTGALGVTPAHSAVDWQMAEENDLEIVKVIDEDGNIRDGFGNFSGKTVDDAREIVVEELKKRNLIEREEEIDNKLSICYRCDTAVEPLPSLQWFINVNKKLDKFNGKSIKDICIDAVEKGVFGRDKIKIVPERFEKNYFHWMRNLRDWCISRQILFGHQVPVWYRPCHPERAERVEGSLEQEIYVGVEKPEGEGWTQDTDTLDTWFSSGLWTFSTLANSPEQIKIENGKLVIDSEDFKHFHPTAVLETGYDILFFWVARMIIMTAYAVEDIPFQDVYLHGLVLDEKGKKMSKSKGNVIDPLDMIKKYGTDATRLSLVIGSTPGNDLRLSEEKVAGFRNLVNKIWNIYRYAFSNYELRITNYELDEKKLTNADHWILKKMFALTNNVKQHLENYNFSQAGEMLIKFTRDDLADWYLEVSKFEKSETKERIMAIVLNDLLKLWHPFIPFVTEVIWNELEYKKMLITSGWAEDINYVNIGVGDHQSFGLIKETVTSIRNARAENKIEPAKKVKAIIYAGKRKELIESQAKIIKNLKTGISELEVKETGEDLEGEILITVEDIKIYLIGAIDKEKEAQRIKKEIENLEKVIKGIESKLNNKEFVEKAPKEVVEREQERLKGFKKELEALSK